MQASTKQKMTKALPKVLLLLVIFFVIQICRWTDVIGDYDFTLVVTLCINIMLAVSLNLITGFTGQFSLGHAGFMSIGAYVCAIVLLKVNGTVWGFLLGLVAGAIAAGVIGFLVGLPTLRLKGDYLAIATLGMAEIIRIVFQNATITNGAAGLSYIPSHVNWVILFVLTAGTVLLLSNFIKSSHGRACIAIREDEIASNAMGVSPTKYKVLAFTVGAFVAGIAGAVYSSFFTFIKPSTFNFQKSIDILVIVVLGGMGSLSGSIIAAAVLSVINVALQSFPELRMIIYSVLLVVIMVFRPQGLMGDKEVSIAMFKRAGKGISNLFTKHKKDAPIDQNSPAEQATADKAEPVASQPVQKEDAQ